MSDPDPHKHQNDPDPQQERIDAHDDDIKVWKENNDQKKRPQLLATGC
jgi:hypothetical protein